MLIAAVLGSEAIDSSGEILDVAGADISDKDTPGGILVNWEHEPGEKGADTIIGKVVFAKKIFKESDCDNEIQKDQWEQIKMPFITGIVRLFDGAGHEKAKAVAAIIRDNVANKEPVACRWSVEGSTLEKTGNRLKASVIRRLACTIKPCNKTAGSKLLEDPEAPIGFEKSHVKKVKDLLDFEDAAKSEHPLYASLAGSCEIICNPIVDDLAKASIGGMGGAAPSTLTGGAALQREEFIKKPFSKYMDLMEKYDAPEFDKSEFRTYAKMQMPEASSEFLDHFANIAEDYHIVKGKKIKKHVTSFNLDALDLQLRKAAEEKTEKPSPPIDTPEVYKMSVAMDGKHRQTGRFMIANDQLHHLENYHGIMENMLPEGPFDGNMISKINHLRNSPYVSIERDSIPLTPKTTAPSHVPLLPTAKIPAHRPSVFQYMRVGMDKPHLLEIIDGHHFLDGNKLSYQEMATVMQNIKNKAATLRYPKSKYANQIQKMEQVLEDLMKNEELNPEDALSHISAAVKAGHIHPDVETALRNHVFGDPMVPGIGNKYAYQQFRSKNHPGVYISADLNDLKGTNDQLGHDAGDSMIKGAFGAMRDVAAKVGNGKVFRPGGDEAMIHFPSHEHAAQFIRHAQESMDRIPPINGTHKISSSFGLGNDFATADKALYHAKAQKINPQTGLRNFPIGQTPHLSHSLVPGHVGPIPPHNLGVEAVHSHVPKISETPKLQNVSSSSALSH